MLGATMHIVLSPPIMTNLFIFNTDFRLRDNPALFYAAENGESLVAMFIHNQQKMGKSQRK